MTRMRILLQAAAALLLLPGAAMAQEAPATWRSASTW